MTFLEIIVKLFESKFIGKAEKVWYIVYDFNTDLIFSAMIE